MKIPRSQGVREWHPRVSKEKLLSSFTPWTIKKSKESGSKRVAKCRKGKKRVKPAQTIATMLRKRSPRLFDGSRVPKCKSDERERLEKYKNSVTCFAHTKKRIILAA